MSILLTEYTLQEVSTHKTDESRWIIINGFVYDVTDFIKHHPGGKEPFEKFAGTDATVYFKKIKKHSTQNVTTFMTTLCVGKLKTN